MIIAEIHPRPDWVLSVVANDGRAGTFDLTPYLADEAFAPLRDTHEFLQVTNRGYFLEWVCGADLSADTIEAKWRTQPDQTVEDIEDARSIERAKAAHGGKPRLSWSQVKKEAGLE